ncbi:MAG: sensor signal transduction histidine kinase [Bacteroidota bacterium]|jgi:PAS domain S-box-containing protein|nr:sensor signal transduction histidine kinase [Bacteroidota bacterium]
MVKRDKDIVNEPISEGNEDYLQFIKSFQWEETALGQFDTWPESLRSALNIAMNSEFAVIIYWGAEMIRVYNHSYSKLIGKNHPAVLGKPGGQVLPGVWEVMGDKIERCFRSGEKGKIKNLRIELDRDGFEEECFFSVSYYPLYNHGLIAGVYVTIKETTEKAISEKKILALRDKQLANLFLKAPIALCIFKGPDFIVDTANELMLELWGKTREQVQDKPVMKALPEIAGQSFEELLRNVYTTGEPFVSHKMPATLHRNGKLETIYVKFVYEALREEDGNISGIMAMADEITPLVNTLSRIEESEERLRMAIETTRLGTWDYFPGTGELTWSDECRAIYDFPDGPKIDFQLFADLIYPEDKGYALSKIQEAMNPEGSGRYDIKHRIVRYSDGALRWVHATGKVLFNDSEKPERFIGTLIDITESHNMEIRLRDKEQRMRLAIEASKMGTYDWNIKTSEFLFSKRVAEIFGYTDERSLTQESFAARIHPDDKGGRVRAHDEAFLNGTLFYESRVIWPDSSVHWIRLHGKVIFDDKGKPDKMYGTVTDITDEKNMIRELEESEKRFKTVADTAPVMIWTSDKTKKCDFFNKGWLDFTGRSLAEELGDGWVSGLHPNDVERTLSVYHSAFEAKKKFSIEYRMLRHDGQYRWLSDEGTPRYNVEGEFLGFIGSCIDIQEKKMAREELERKVLERTSELNKRNNELQEQKEFVDTILDASVDIIAVLDTELRYVKLNKKAYDLYSAQKSDLIGKKIYEIYPEIMESGMYADLQEALKGKLVHASHYKSAVFDKHFDNYYIPLKDHRNEVYGVLVLSHDNTAIVKAAATLEHTNRILEEKNLELERSNRELESFSYVASHDLQEPLRKIRTFSELVQKNLHDEAAVKKYFGKIDSSAKRMADLIRAVLNYSRLSRDNDHFEMVNLNEIIEHVKSDYELLIQETKTVITHTELPVIKGISLQLNQLFSNLIGNSIKFSNDEPVISITYEFIEADAMPENADLVPGKKYIELIFKDNGIGFEQQYSDQIFTIFKRLHGNQEYTGTGIGLALCKKIVENHKGLISVQSEPGKGTEFFVYLPAE